MSEEIAALNQRIRERNYERMVRECKCLNRDVLYLTDKNRELKFRIAELEDELALEKKWGRNRG